MADARPVRAAPGSAAFLAIVERAVPARPGHDHSRPMCAAWDDHLRKRRIFLASGPVFFAPWPPGSPSRWQPAGFVDPDGWSDDELDFPAGLAPQPHRSEPRRPR